MRTAIAMCMVGVLMCGAAYGTNYTFSGTTFPALWDGVTNWTPELVLPGTTGDNYTIPVAVAAGSQIRPPNTNVGQMREFGQLTMLGGNLYLQGSGTLRFRADNGLTGGLYLDTRTASVGWSYTGTGPTFDMDGNFIMNPSSGSTVIYPGMVRVIMRGNNTIFRLASGSETYNHARRVLVDNNIAVNFQAPSGGRNYIEDINLGTNTVITGAVGTSVLKTVKIARGSGVDSSGLDVYMMFYENDWGSGNGNPRNGAGLFITPGRYRDIDLGNAWNNVTASARYMANAIGDFQGRTLNVMYNSGGGSRGVYWLNTDNGVTSNVTVDCDLFIGRNSTTSTWVVGLNAGRSTIDVGRDLTIKGGGSAGANYMTFTTGTLRVGQHLTVENGIGTGSLWNMGTSNTIFDGNFGSDCGTYTAQTITSKSLPFYSVEINTPGGTVTLADNLVLKGNFHLTSGALAVGSGATARYIIFKGGIDNEDLAQTIDIDTAAALKRIYIKAGSSTFVKLLSDLTVTDNLDIDAGCKLFLNGFTLNAEGQTITETTPWDQGEIVGAAIPEPATLLLIGTGALGVLGYVRRRRMI